VATIALSEIADSYGTARLLADVRDTNGNLQAVTIENLSAAQARARAVWAEGSAEVVAQPGETVRQNLPNNVRFRRLALTDDDVIPSADSIELFFGR
jgi:hypothetical protein